MLTCDVLDDPEDYAGFPLLAEDLVNGNHGIPDPNSVHQGSINDCWFVAAVVDFALVDPTAITSPNAGLGGFPPLIVPDGGNSYTVYFPDARVGTVTITLGPDGHSYSSAGNDPPGANGDWLEVLERAYAQGFWDHTPAWLRSSDPYDKINHWDFGGSGIEALTAGGVKRQTLSVTRNSVIRQDLATAFANRKLVTITSGALTSPGIVKFHVYSVVEYNAAADEVLLRNPWGSNPVVGNGNYLGKNQGVIGQVGDNNGYFWMKVTDLRGAFNQMNFEK